MIAPAAIASILGDRTGAVERVGHPDGWHGHFGPQTGADVAGSGRAAATWKRTRGRLSAAASQRAERLARVLAAAEYVMDDRELAQTWMNLPHGELGGKTPLEAARTELGARCVEDILNSLLFGSRYKGNRRSFDFAQDDRVFVLAVTATATATAMATATADSLRE